VFPVSKRRSPKTEKERLHEKKEVALMRRSLMRLMVVAAMAAIVASLVSAPIVLGQEQEQGGKPIDAGFTQTINPGDYPGTCTFPVDVEVSGKGKTIELPGGKGLIITSPGLNATLRSENNQETYNITGSVRPRTLEDGSVEYVLTGRNLAIDPEAGFVVAVENYSFTFDAAGNLSKPLSGEGQLIDVCEALA
jgi:hypothetical protein